MSGDCYDGMFDSVVQHIHVFTLVVNVDLIY